jgi:hypothetical protein
MSQRTQRAFRILSWSAVAALACSLAAAQDSAPPSVAEQLQAQYKLAKLTRDSSGNVAIAEGTVLAIQKQGLVGVPVTNPLNPCASTYADGRLKAPGFFCQVGTQGLGGLANNNAPTVDLAVGHKAYPASIAVDAKRDTVKFLVVACEPCNGDAPPTYYKAEVDFRFPRGFLATGDASQVEDTIGQVFSIDSGGDAAPAQDAQPGPAQAASPAPAPASPEPVSIQQGQTIAEVEQALGKPAKTIRVAAKVIYVYSDLKITFRNGRVTNVQ